MSQLRKISHPAMFQGPGSVLYNLLVPHFTRRLHQRVIDNVASTLTVGTVLDVGTGPGQLAVQMARQQPGVQVIGVDISADMITLARQNALRERLDEERVRFAVSTETSLPVPDESIDMVVSTLSMHHWRDVAAMMHELARVVRPGGQIALYDMQVPRPPINKIEQVMPDLPLDQMQVEQLPVRIGLLPKPGMVRCMMRRV